jgi:hypothetical protein
MQLRARDLVMPSVSGATMPVEMAGRSRIATRSGVPSGFMLSPCRLPSSGLTPGASLRAATERATGMGTEIAVAVVVVLVAFAIALAVWRVVDTKRRQ